MLSTNIHIVVNLSSCAGPTAVDGSSQNDQIISIMESPLYTIVHLYIICLRVLKFLPLSPPRG